REAERDGEGDDAVPEDPALERGDPERGGEQEQREHHRRVAGVERALARVRDDEPAPQRTERDRDLRAYARARPEVDLDVATVERAREQREEDEQQETPGERARGAAEPEDRGTRPAGGRQRVAPRCAGVPLLVQEGPDPREERQAPDADGDEQPYGRASVRAADRGRGEERDDDADERERPVVRVQQEPGDGGDGGEARQRRLVERAQHREVAARDEEHD